jgi:hypothetical protein
VVLAPELREFLAAGVQVLTGDGHDAIMTGVVR